MSSDVACRALARLVALVTPGLDFKDLREVDGLADDPGRLLVALYRVHHGRCAGDAKRLTEGEKLARRRRQKAEYQARWRARKIAP